MKLTTDNLFYFGHINSVGGVETFYYYLASKYGDNDITIVCHTGDEKQLARLSRYVRVIKHKEGMTYKCKRAFFNFNLNLIDQVEADEYFQILHGDYKNLKLMPDYSDKIDRYLAVSKVACESFEELTGHKVELIYNPVIRSKPKRVLHLLSATRLTREKGEGRMRKLIRELDKQNIPYRWDIYTDSPQTIQSPNICYHEPRLDIIDFIADADYLVQLSDTEGYCYTVVESLMQGTPVIITPCPVFKEIGCNTKNSITVPFDMSKIPIKKIIGGLEPFDYRPKRDKWNQYLIKGKSTWKEELDALVLVECTTPFIDKEHSNTYRNIGDTWYVKPERADLLINKVKFAKEVKQ